MDNYKQKLNKEVTNFDINNKPLQELNKNYKKEIKA